MKQEDILTITAQSVAIGHSLRKERDTLVNFGTKGMAIGGGIAFGISSITSMTTTKIVETFKPETPPAIAYGISLGFSTIAFFSVLVSTYMGIKSHIQKFDNHRSQQLLTK